MIILELLIILFLFFGPPICVEYFGWSTITEYSYLTSFHPVLYLLIIYTFISFPKLLKNKFYVRSIVFIVLTVVVSRLLFGDSLIRFTANLLIPVLFSFFITQVIQKERTKIICKKWFIFLFLLETSIALFEKATKTLIFPYSLFNPEDVNGMATGIDYFRSNSLLGHPLSNALCVAVVIAFIAVSNNISAYLRYTLLGGGFISLLCFNARFAIIVSFGLYILFALFKNRFSLKSYIGLLLVIGVVSYLVFQLGFGDRLFSEGVKSDDDSILARIDILEMLSHINLDFIFRGLGFDALQKRSGFEHIENWVLIMVFDSGLLLTIYYIYMLVRLSFMWLIGLPVLTKIYLFSIFIIIASSNNSLATAVPALSFFIISSALLVDKKVALGT